MVDRSRVASGGAGERRAALEYSRLGFDVLDRNWRAPGGEIDLVVARDDLLVFVEVKTRRRSGFGGAAAAVGSTKQARVRVTAAEWIRQHPERSGDRIRFDVVAIHGTHIEIIDAAF